MWLKSILWFWRSRKCWEITDGWTYWHWTKSHLSFHLKWAKNLFSEMLHVGGESQIRTRQNCFWHNNVGGFGHTSRKRGQQLNRTLNDNFIIINYIQWWVEPIPPPPPLLLRSGQYVTKCVYLPTCTYRCISTAIYCLDCILCEKLLKNMSGLKIVSPWWLDKERRRTMT